jgi:hypothetical protein
MTYFFLKKRQGFPQYALYKHNLKYFSYIYVFIKDSLVISGWSGVQWVAGSNHYISFIHNVSNFDLCQ